MAHFMDINRVIRAVQRTTHLTTGQMHEQYTELFEIQSEIEMEQRIFYWQLMGLSLQAEVKGVACRLPSRSATQGK